MEKNNPDNFIAELVSRYYESMVAYCSAKLNGDYSEGENCAIDVFQQAVKDKVKLINHPNIVGWLKVTATNRVKRVVRDRTKRYSKEIQITDLTERYEESLSYIQTFDEEFDREHDVAKEKQFILEQLSPDEYELYSLRFVDKLTYKEIAEKFGLSESAVRMRTVRLELKIKQLAAKLYE